MKIVTNQKGLYAIKKGFWPFDRYFDLDTPGYWWWKTSRFYTACWSHDKKRVEAWFGILNPKKAIIICSENDKELMLDKHNSQEENE